MDRRAMLLGGGGLALSAAGGEAYAETRRMGSMGEYDEGVAKSRAALSVQPEVREWIRFATLAPSGHNTQPWRFRTRRGRVDILPDRSRATPVVDADDHHMFVALGGAAENLSLAAAAHDRPGHVAFDPLEGGSVTFAIEGGPPADRTLFDAVTHRRSSRTEFDGRRLSNTDLRKLAASAAVAGVDLVLITDRPGLDRTRDLVVAGNAAQMADPAFTAELKHWMRFSPRRALSTGDGLFSVSSGGPMLPDWLGPAMFDLEFRAPTENTKYARQLKSCSGVAVFLGEKADRDHWVRIGRACQRFALQATALGVQYAFVNQPVEVSALRPELAQLVGAPGRRPDLVIRFGYGPSLPLSARRQLDAVLG